MSYMLEDVNILNKALSVLLRYVFIRRTCLTYIFLYIIKKIQNDPDFIFSVRHLFIFSTITTK